MSPRRRHILVTCFVLLQAAGPAVAQESESGNGWFPNFALSRLSETQITLPFGATLSFYGQVSPLLMIVNDSDDIDIAAADNNHGVSRIGAVIQHKANGRIFQFQFETTLGVRTSTQPTQNQSDPLFDWDRSDIRIADFSWKFANGQVFSIGQGKMATDGVTSLDLSRTSIANSVSIPDIAGGYRFRTNAGVLSPFAVKDVFQTYDGVRRVRLRFDTRNRSGVWFSVSAGIEALEKDGSQKDIDTAVFYERDNQSFHLQAAAGQSISKESGQKTRADTVGSVSVLHKPTGLNATLATGARFGQGGYGYLKLGYITRLFPIGQTAFAVDFQRSENIVNDKTAGDAWGIAVVQEIDDLNGEVFVGFRNFAFSENSTVRYRDIRTVFFGARWKF